jgi:hypothetical protein
MAWNKRGSNTGSKREPEGQVTRLTEAECRAKYPRPDDEAGHGCTAVRSPPGHAGEPRVTGRRMERRWWLARRVEGRETIQNSHRPTGLFVSRGFTIRPFQRSALTSQSQGVHMYSTALLPMTRVPSPIFSLRWSQFSLHTWGSTVYLPNYICRPSARNAKASRSISPSPPDPRLRFPGRCSSVSSSSAEE